MTEPDRSAETQQRIFIALNLPMAMEQGLAAWGRRALADPALRPTRPEALHVTLCFLGLSDRQRVQGLIKVVEALQVEPVTLRLNSQPVSRPEGKPRLFALEVAGDAVCALQARLQADLVKSGLHEPDKPPFWPHVTVARVRSRSGSRGQPRRVLNLPEALPAALLDPFSAVRVSLYRSDLRPRGAEYVSLARKDLPPTA